ncbi:glycosyl transferase family 2 [Flavobacteriaceae bacterium MAR_2010_72]|nr:glycosyl transferase family 2 [Flavobacteriaceae bacterium MAR_2010_72]TVZ59320.1 glycosyl transferase family 2 [Flavobacteriaceae bacterium MAR_2010_105]
MQQPLVSIIIPFYNEEAYLSRAMNSVINQNYPCTEIILVNDGSTDGSKQIADEYCNRYSNVKIINSPNESLGAARNKGVSLANGSYITFLDADDELYPDMLDNCVKQIIDDQCDLVVAKFELFDDSKRLLKVSGWIEMPRIQNAMECVKAIYNNKIVPTAWGKLYKTAIVKKYRFPEKIWFEDNPFLLEFLFNSRRVGFIDKPLLKIHSRSESITRRTISDKRILDLNKAFFLQLDLVKEYVLSFKEQQKIMELIFKNQYRALLDTFILYSIDKRKLRRPNQSNIRKSYLQAIGEVKAAAAKMQIKLPIKNQLLLILLSSPRSLGWRIPYLLLYIIKNKKFKYLKQLKG